MRVNSILLKTNEQDAVIITMKLCTNVCMSMPIK